VIPALALVVVTVIWGTSFTVVKDVLDRGATPYALIAARYGITALVFLPLVVKRRRHFTRDASVRGIFLGVLALLALWTQTIGLQTTTATRSAFLTATCCVMVPVLIAVRLRRHVDRSVLLGILVASVGLALLLRPDLGQGNRGDLWTLVCALFYAVYLVSLEESLKRFRYEPILFVQAVVASVAAAALAPLLESPALPLSGPVTFDVLFLALLPTAAATFLQNRYSGEISAERAALIYTAEPVVAAGFARLVLGEALTGLGYAGAGLVLVGILVGGRPSAATEESSA
jgi:drug/metabolite transporter (DMT)-like permease